MPQSAGIPFTTGEFSLAPRVNRSFSDDLAQATVLVIEDEPGMRNFLSKVLTGTCARVDVLADVRDASRLLDEIVYDMIILDNIMPEKTELDWLC